MFFLGSSTYGESFNPAKDCSDIVDNLAKAEDGFYWVSLNKKKPQKVFTFVRIKMVEKMDKTVNLFIFRSMIFILIIRFGVTCIQMEEDLCWLE